MEGRNEQAFPYQHPPLETPGPDSLFGLFAQLMFIFELLEVRIPRIGESASWQ